MPKRTNSPPQMRQDGDYACVYLHGKRIRMGRWDSADAQKNYRQFLLQWAALPVASTILSEGKATIDELVLAFLSHKKGKCGDADYTTYRPPAINLAVNA